MHNILLIEDIEASRCYLQIKLSKENFQVFEALNGNEALEICRNNPIHLIITDIFMPEKDGLEVIREFRKEFPDIKIFAYSAAVDSLGESYYLKEAKEFGAVETFGKPIDFKKLISAIHQHLS